MTVALSGMTLHTNNDNESGWGGTDGPDDYNNAEQGTNSESMLVSKNSTETATLTKSSALPTTRGLFTFWMATSLAPYYTDIELDLQSTTNNFKKYTVTTAANREISGDFKPVAVDYVNNGAETGTFAAASFALLRLIIDNSTSGNIRSVINTWIDAMYYGAGHTISGTTASDTLFAEAAAVDELTANKYGVMWQYNDIIYSQGDIDLTGTALVSEGEVLVFVDTSNGYDTYNLDVSGTVTFTNTTIIAGGSIDYNFDASGATSFTMTGGSLTGYATLSTAAAQSISGVVFQSGGTATIANTISGSTFNLCGLITISGAGKLSSCTLNEGTASVAVSAPDLNDLDKCHFISDGTGHAVDLGNVTTTKAMSWDNTESGYASSDGSTGNETIVVNVSNGETLTINVAATGSTPTIKNDGTGTVTVVSGQKTFSFTLNPSITGYEWRLYVDSGVAGELGTTELDGEETATADNQSYSYSYSADEDVVLQIIADGYEEVNEYYTLGNSDLDVTVNMIVEENT